MWDTGCGYRSIAPILSRHGREQIRAFPSHMHHDHLGGVGEFQAILAADLPMIRAIETDGFIEPPESMYLGSDEGLRPPRFPVRGWLKPGAHLMVGRRYLEVWHTPGHSPDSMSLWEAGRNRLYAADLIYPGELYAQVPGASLRDYRATLKGLLDRLPRDVEILCAHGDPGSGLQDVPILRHDDLREVLNTISEVLSEPAHQGERRVNDRMTLLYSEESFTT